MANYKDAGVNIAAADLATSKFKKHVKKTLTKDVLLGVGAFGGAIDVSSLKKMKSPVLVSSIDGVGTKIKIAAATNKWDTVGKDLVNHCANDILCSGAKPLFFLDYIASSKLEPEIVESIVKGMSEACIELGIPLLGGETAEMPGVYAEKEHDVVGCIIGVADREDLLNGSKIKKGDVLLGLESNGLHTNGYSLARKVLLEIANYELNAPIKELGKTLGEELLKVHRTYSKEVLALRKKFRINGITHITGGGLVDNVPRTLPKGLGAKILKSKIKVPKIFRLIKLNGKVDDVEMFKVFNMGIGLVLVVSSNDAGNIIQELSNKHSLNASIIGEVVPGKGVELVE